jgi:hypothetical protein
MAQQHMSTRHSTLRNPEAHDLVPQRLGAPVRTRWFTIENVLARRVRKDLLQT